MKLNTIMPNTLVHQGIIDFTPRSTGIVEICDYVIIL